MCLGKPSACEVMEIISIFHFVWFNNWAKQVPPYHCRYDWASKTELIIDINLGHVVVLFPHIVILLLK